MWLTLYSHRSGLVSDLIQRLHPQFPRILFDKYLRCIKMFSKHCCLLGPPAALLNLPHQPHRGCPTLRGSTTGTVFLKTPLGGQKGSQVEYRPGRQGGTDKPRGRSGTQGGRTAGRAESSGDTWTPGRVRSWRDDRWVTGGDRCHGSLRTRIQGWGALARF